MLEAATDEFLPPQHALDLIGEAAAGSVIAISMMGGASEVAICGGLLTAGAVAKRHAGAVLDGGVRDGVVVVPQARTAEVLKMAQEIDARELEQAKLIIAEKSLRKGLAKYGRI